MLRMDYFLLVYMPPALRWPRGALNGETTPALHICSGIQFLIGTSVVPVCSIQVSYKVTKPCLEKGSSTMHFASINP